jgi:arginyl-tRNA--protein-N-Asp/Glu arginylyltransferase
LSQAYSKDWLAYSPFLKENLSHLKFNNWANAWQFSLEQVNLLTTLATQESTVYLFYWPQILEYLGFVALLGVSIWLIIYYSK